jgi:DNA-binding MarR family transcriptional regulator/GNAT superfamily N-acetyltransferase
MADLQRSVAAVRRFNRFYTRRIGVLAEGFLDSPFSLTEVRVLYELAARQVTSATELRRELEIDGGYLSRMLQAFHRRGLIQKKASATDGRRSELSLSAAGREQFARLDDRQRVDVERMLGALPPKARQQLLQRMQSMEKILAPAQGAAPPAPYTLRMHRPGDMGWITHRQAVLYHQEYGWDERYEALIARIMADFVENFDPKKERCWVAERDGEIVGSVFCVKKSPTVAKLRLLYVEPSTRGLGIGTRLTDECIAFARARGYRKLTLWTNSVLLSARRIYERAGFALVEEKRHHSFGHDLVGQTWDLMLGSK